jgi:hypothetical protein
MAAAASPNPVVLTKGTRSTRIKANPPSQDPRNRPCEECDQRGYRNVEKTIEPCPDCKTFGWYRVADNLCARCELYLDNDESGAQHCVECVLQIEKKCYRCQNIGHEKLNNGDWICKPCIATLGGDQ